MAKRMLIDATHPEETRVVVLNGNRLEEFDFESSTKQQVKGNIYLAKVTRVEPSLQAAFVEYGGNRHGFLAFSEIHPDYFRIPVGDREAFGGDQNGADRGAPEIAAEMAEDAGVLLAAALPEPVAVVEAPSVGDDEAPAAESSIEKSWPTDENLPQDLVEDAEERAEAARAELPWEDLTPFVPASPAPALEPGSAPEQLLPVPAFHPNPAIIEEPAAAGEWAAALASDGGIAAAAETAFPMEARAPREGENGDAETIETLGGDEFEEAERQRSRAPRHYKIQEVIKRRQIMLVQVTKEERGNKGAALTSYLSLAGRYCVLMPNTARGGGVSRKITSITDRRRLKDILEELDIPGGMGVIVRTAGAERSKAEIKRDYEYLLRLWNEIRELTLKSTAPALIYEEGNLIKRSIRDLYTRDIDEVLVEGEEGYRTAKSFMKMLMPSHAKRVQPYRDLQVGLLHRFQVESQIDAIHSPIVQLRSGGYVVINQTEALVAIDVNSGRSTRERNIEETALRTNLEAAEEIARQLRLRDLAGLIVIDFIDMEEHRNQGAVERRLKDALKNDRARIQVGRISPFGLLEMSRQRLRPSLAEASTQPCPHCGGTGFIRSTESTALYVLRSIEEEGMRRRSAEVCVYVPTMVALYILNHKRDSLAQLETRYGIHVLVARDDALIPPAFRLDRLRAYEPGEVAAAAIPAPLTQLAELDEEEVEEPADDEVEGAEAELRGQDGGEDRGRGRARRRRRRRPRHEDERSGAPSAPAGEDGEEEAGERVAADDGEAAEDRNGDEEGNGDRQRRRRGRRGGRRRGRREEGAEPSFEGPRPATDMVEIVAATATESIEAGTYEAAQSERAMTESVAPWPAEAALESAREARPEAVWEASPEPGAEAGADTIASGVEAASMPALAGETAGLAAPSNGLAPGYSVPEAPAATVVVEDTVLPAATHATHGDGFVLAPPGDSEAQAGAPPVEESTGGGETTAPREIEARAAPEPPAAPESLAASESPAASEPPAAPESSTAPEPLARPETPAASESTHAPPSPSAHPADAVRAVTEKPESPRRGWWQRLMQS